MMTEAQEIATRFGATFRVDIERRVDGAARVGAHRTSMLQDLESGRPLEIDALLTSVQEMGRLVERRDALHRHGARAGAAARPLA